MVVPVIFFPEGFFQRLLALSKINQAGNGEKGLPNPLETIETLP
ncbi:hypothetical protein LEP1GSC050_1551 [Leptospira broomii serovar Hurstbridge str. 5399]|uniref:Uncharacterized protein n=1 Tax=Leptospira broomii serovar Hurstbridge str. 5399 TaxID=1049789 RepID=T0EWH3_9LEPT|nr:hypothetical protein LEP1GSC050_1551 [Leptospira broomii serovar Hurstbridge str. 5399]